MNSLYRIADPGAKPDSFAAQRGAEAPLFHGAARARSAPL